MGSKEALGTHGIQVIIRRLRLFQPFQHLIRSSNRFFRLLHRLSHGETRTQHDRLDLLRPFLRTRRRVGHRRFRHWLHRFLHWRCGNILLNPARSLLLLLLLLHWLWSRRYGCGCGRGGRNIQRDQSLHNKVPQKGYILRGFLRLRSCRRWFFDGHLRK